ncbi:MAG TPA: glycosyltransferase [Bacteroidia bacterium]|nr:glycosyltransferase [Bacteroidia bacterium]
MEAGKEIIPLKVGFHYHIPALKANDGSVLVPSFLGTFLDGLAAECDILYCLLFSALKSEEQMCNYTLQSKNIIWVDMGPHASIPQRYLRSNAAKKIIKELEEKVDVMLVRTPTPYIPFFSRIINKKKLALYIVGDYSLSGEMKMKQPKKFLTQILYRYMSGAEDHFAKQNGLVITNSRNLFERFGTLTKNVLEIKSTTITGNSFYKRPDTCTKKPVNLLYTGRLEPLKNIPLIFGAVKELISQGIAINFNMAYVMDAASAKYLEYLKKLVETLGIKNNVIFHGQKKIGDELNAVYRSCDIYIIASSTEGFPRGAWEAMANSVPVIATKVGSIPYFLEDREDAVLIDPNNKGQIVDAIKEVVLNDELRRKIISNGYELASDNTIERQSYKMISSLYNYINS